METLIRASFVVALLLIHGAAPAVAQHELRFGIRGGISASAIQFDEPATAAQTNARTAFRLGVVVSKALTSRFDLESGLTLDQEGFRGAGAHIGDLRLDFVSLPLALRVRAPGLNRLSLTVGTALRLRVACDLDGGVQVGRLACDDPTLGEPWRRTDVAAGIGLGLTTRVVDFDLVTDLGVLRGLRDLDGAGHVPGTARSLSAGVSVSILRGGRGGAP